MMTLEHLEEMNQKHTLNQYGNELLKIARNLGKKLKFIIPYSSSESGCTQLVILCKEGETVSIPENFDIASYRGIEDAIVVEGGIKGITI